MSPRAPRRRTRSFPAGGAAALAMIGLLPALVVLAWPGGVVVWFAALAISLALLAWGRGLLAPPDALEVRRELPERMYIGVEAEVVVTVHNRGARPVRIEVRDAPPQALGDGELGPPVVLAPGEQRRYPYTVRPCDRGRYDFHEVWLRWWSPGRLWLRQHRVEVPSSSSVYPDIRALTDVSPLLIRKLYAELGIKEQRLRGQGTEFDHIKEHTPDDGTTRVDWKASARRLKPMVRTYRVEQNHDVLIGIDTGRLMGSRVDGITKLDHAINASLLLSRVALVSGDRPGLMTFDARVRRYVRPASDRGQMERLLHTLHDLDSDFGETSFRRALVYLDRHHKKRSLVVLLTDFVHGQADEQLVASMLGLARRHLVLFVALRDPQLDALARELPADLDATYAKVVAQGLAEDRAVVMRTLRQRGVQTLDQVPAEVTQGVINRYLRVRQGI